MPKSTTILSNIVSSRIFTYACLVIILVMGGLFRLTNLDWDEEQHQHPDERFLTMVTSDMTWPDSFEHYFDPLTSELSPYAKNPEVWYVYGTVPIYLTKWVAVTLDKDSFNEIYLVGRALSGMFDLGCIFFLFLIARRLYDDRVALLSSALYALAVHPIQLSHFFAVDTFANFFVAMTIYWSIRASERGIWVYYLLMGISLGAGMASKMSVLTLGVVVVLAGVLDFYRFYQRTSDIHTALEHLAVRWATVGITTLLVFRILQPIAFEGPGFFNFRLSQIWKDDIDQMRALVDGTESAPYLIQWTDRTPLWFPWKNMVIWGMGLPLGLTAWSGWLLASYELICYRKIAHLLPVFYIGIAFLYHGTRWIKYMRYFMPIYPLLALMAGYLVIWVWNRARTEQWARQNDTSKLPNETKNEPAQDIPETTVARPTHIKRLSAYALASLLTIVVLGGTGTYALAFTSIYSRTITRIEASRWIYANIPKGSVLANEHWDDSLPLRIDGNDGFYDWYTGITMSNYDPCSPEKLTMMVDNLTNADYVILSSNRLYDSIPRMPLRYPIATRYYHLLFAEQLGFHKVAEFTSYPQLFGYELPDQEADESFSVYDHPKVMIYQKGHDFDPQQVRTLLQSDIDWYTVIDLMPKKATSAPTGLMFMRDDRAIYQKSGTWSAMFNPVSLSNRYPIVFWFLAIEIIGVITLPITFVVFHAMHDRGYIFSKVIGLLLVGWGSWLMASWRWVSFSQETIVLVVLLLLLISGLLFGTRSQEMKAAVQSKWRVMLFAEVLFWLLFAGLALIRWNSPDLWFTPDNESTPISLATLTSVVKSPYFPPYDPWFGGGYLNIPYLGYVLVAVLIKLTSIVPSIAYNLALPTWIALAAVGAWSIVFNMVTGWRTASEHASSPDRANAGLGQAIALGVLALFLVALAGNMKQVQCVVLPTVRASSYLDVSRIIPAEEGEPSLKTEFPFFSFLAGDLSPHVLSLPFLLLIVALAVQTIRQPIAPALHVDQDRDAREGAKVQRPNKESDKMYTFSHIVRRTYEVGILLLLGLGIGALWPLNTWDAVPATLIIAGAFMVRAYRHQQHNQSQAQHGFRYGAYCKRTRQQSWERPHHSPPLHHERTRTWQPELDLIAIGWSIVWRTGFIVLLGYLAFLPFHQTYGSPNDGFALWKGSRMPLEAYLVINGLFFFITTSFLLLDMGKWADQNSIVRLLIMVIRHWQRFPRMHRLYCRLVQTQLWHELALYALLFAVVFLLLLVVFKQLVLALSVLLLTLSLLLLLRRRSAPRRQVTILLIGLGHALMIATNLVTLKSFDVALEAPARIQTVQMFSFQLWVIWGLASAACIAFIAPRLRIAGMATDTTNGQEERDRPKPRRAMTTQVREGLASLGAMAWWLMCFALVVSAAHYTVFGTLDKLDNSQATLAHAATLDGMATMQGVAYTFTGTEMSLDEEREAIAWMHEHITGSPVIVECPYPDYTFSMRVATLTGLPVVIGWPEHEKQQRALLPSYVVDIRLRDVDVIYTEPDPDAVLSLLRKHQVEFVYIGALERYRYGEHIVGNFENGEGRYWDRVYEHGDVRVYRVR